MVVGRIQKIIKGNDWGQSLILGLSLLFLFTFCIYPFSVLIFKVLFPSGSFSLKFIESVLSHSGAIKAFTNTGIVSLCITVLSVLMAVPVGWVLSRTDLPKAKAFRSWFCLPYAIPPYVGAMAWIYLANPTTGILNQWLGGSYFNVYSYVGLIWVEASFLYTFVLLAVLTSLDRMDPSLEEAARLSGASPWQVFSKITLPLIRPAITSGGVLVALAAAASFGVPALIGNPAKIYLVTTQIYTFQKMGSMQGLFQAGALSILLLVVALFLLFLNQRLNKGRQYRIVSGKTSRPSEIELGRLKIPSLVGLVFLLFVLFILPMAGITYTAFSSMPGSESSLLGLTNFQKVFLEMNETGRAIGNSLYLATMAATFATLLAIFLSYMQWKTKLKGRHLLEISASFPYSIPGTVVALALILAFSRGIFGIGPSLYNTFTLLGLAYLIKFLSLAMKTIGDGFGQIDDSLAEAARVSGANWVMTMKRIWLPLMKPSVIAAWFLIFMPAFSELTMTVLLSGPGIETLGTLIFQLQQYADPTGGASAVLALLVVTVVLIINGLVKYASKGKYGL